MAKKTQGTDTKQHDIAAPPENRPLDKSIVRYIVRALLLIILFAWALMNLDAVMKFLGKVISLFSPFLIGGSKHITQVRKSAIIKFCLKSGLDKFVDVIK